MVRSHVARHAVLLTILVFPLILTAQPKNGLEGMWQGSLSVQGMKLRMVFHLADISGGYRATMDSPDQGAKGIPTDTTIVKGDSVRILMRRIGGSFVGAVQAGDSVMEGAWNQSGTTFPIRLVKTTIPITHRRPQTPLPPFPYLEEEVVVNNVSAKITIAGTLTIPRGPGPFPAVVLITGSGAQDRDETIFEHKPFRLIADHLTRNGIAVLRCDDRGVGKSGGSFARVTSADFATDIGAAVDHLLSRSDIRHDRIGLVGHSEGGIIAPMVAAQRPDIAFIVLLAGPSMTGAEIIIEQDSLISLANGAPKDDVVRRLRDLRELFEIGRRQPDTARARQEMSDHALATARAFNPQGKADSVLVTETDQLVSRLSGTWMRFFLYHDPMTMLRKVRCPILALNGEKDLQVPAPGNLRGIEQAGREAGNADVTTRTMPGLNHLFQTATTGSPMEYATIEETMSPDALRAMTDWILARTR